MASTFSSSSSSSAESLQKPALTIASLPPAPPPPPTSEYILFLFSPPPPPFSFPFFRQGRRPPPSHRHFPPFVCVRGRRRTRGRRRLASSPSESPVAPLLLQTGSGFAGSPPLFPKPPIPTPGSSPRPKEEEERKKDPPRAEEKKVGASKRKAKVKSSEEEAKQSCVWRQQQKNVSPEHTERAQLQFVSRKGEPSLPASLAIILPPLPFIAFKHTASEFFFCVRVVGSSRCANWDPGRRKEGE